MTRLIECLRNRSHALVAHCAAMMLRRRMRRAQAQLSPRMRAEADFWRARFLAREERLRRERMERDAGRQPRVRATPDTSAVQTLDKNEVLAAIARGRVRREALRKIARGEEER
ncbi:MAG TPA: hypothetical protein VJ727_09400 [Rhodanobacteraceae bacterium]|nr:hypothetical protein [Rhodanobacteraceae bacterium]